MLIFILENIVIIFEKHLLIYNYLWNIDGFSIFRILYKFKYNMD